MVVQAGTEGVLVVDSLPASLATAALAAIRRVSDQPIHFIINTQADDAYTGGNEALAKAGPTRPGRSNLAASMGGNTGGATSILAHENVLNRMSASGNGRTPRPTPAWPSDTYFEEQIRHVLQ